MSLTYEQMAKLASVNATAVAEARVVIMDVRGRDEVRDTGMIPTAINIPHDEMASAVGLSESEFRDKYKSDMPAKERKIVTYCLRGLRAEKARTELAKAGYSDVETYPGSWAEWEKHSAK